MADIRIKDLPTTATQTASDDFIALDGTVNGTRKIDASAPSFKTSVTSPSIVAPAATALTLTGGSTGASLVLGNTNTGASLGGGGLAVGSSASFVVGATAGVATNTVGVPQISASSNTYSSIASIAHNTVNGNHGFLLLGKSRGTKASPTIVADGDTLGSINYVAYDGAAYRAPATISAVITGTPGATDLPTRLALSVAPDGSSAPAEVVSIMPTGNLLIGTTTDMTGSGGLKIAGTTAATSTTSGALIVAGGVGVSGAGYFGGDVTRSGAGESLFIATTSNTASSGRIRLANTGASGRTFDLMSSGSTAADPSLQSKFSIYDITQGAARMTIDSTGAATFGASPKTVTISGQQIIASGDTGPEFRVTRATSGIGGYVRYKTGATDDWVVGSGASGINSDYEVFSYGTSSVAFKLARDTAAATFAGAVTAGGVVVKKNYTVATLPAAASWTYGEAYVSDATQAAGTSLGSAPTGGGSVKRGVYSDGSSWLLR